MDCIERLQLGKPSPLPANASKSQCTAAPALGTTRVVVARAVMEATTTPTRHIRRSDCVCVCVHVALAPTGAPSANLGCAAE